MKGAYYNEIDPFAAQWLRNLIARGLIAPGDVDTRSIEDVRPDELQGYAQCHFFAGIGGWSLALRLAGWPDDRPVWTGSCPCQPFSAAGKGRGQDDERHLWPAWFHLIDLCRPRVIFGEQVEAAVKHGWLDLVQSDLESIGYAVGALGLPAASVGAPHGRARLWFVADHDNQRRHRLPAPRVHGRRDASGSREAAQGSAHRPRGHDADGRGTAGGLADHEAGRRREVHSVGGRGDEGDDSARRQRLVGGIATRSLADSERQGLEGHPGHVDDRGEPGRLGTDATRPVAEGGDVGRMADTERSLGDGGPDFAQRGSEGRAADWGPGAFWSDLHWIPCRDGKARPTQPGLFPLAHGVPGRVGRLRAYGNAIVPQVAAEVIRAYMDSRP